MDNNGLLFDTAIASSTTGLPYIFTGGVSATSTTPPGSSFVPGHFEGLLAFLEQLQENGFAPQGARVENNQDFTIPLQNSFYLKASFGEDAGDLLKNLQLVLASDALRDKRDQIEYVDLRFGDRVYYKLKGT